MVISGTVWRSWAVILATGVSLEPCLDLSPKISQLATGQLAKWPIGELATGHLANEPARDGVVSMVFGSAWGMAWVGSGCELGLCLGMWLVLWLRAVAHGA